MRALGCEETNAAAVVFVAQKSLEVCGGLVMRRGELGSPFHKETVGQPTHEGKDEHGVGMTDPTAIVVVGDVQTLVKAALDAPGLAVELKPSSTISSLAGAAPRSWSWMSRKISAMRWTLTWRCIRKKVGWLGAG